MNASNPAVARGPKWVRILLIASLGLNLVGGGLMLGSWLGHQPGSGSGWRQDTGLGPLAGAMTREDWRAMRPAFIERNPDLDRGPAALHQEYSALLEALRAEPFEAEALSLALQGLSDRNAHRLNTAREVIGQYLLGLSAEARADYAARLDHILEEARLRMERHRARE